MNGLNDKGLFSVAYPFERENKDTTKREEKIWGQFLELYGGVDEQELLEVVRMLINKMTMIMLRGSTNSGINIKNRKKYAKVNNTVRNLENDFFNDDNLEDNSLKSLDRYVFRDSQIKTRLNKLFPGDFSAQREFLKEVMFMAMDTKMKVFLFRYIDNK